MHDPASQTEQTADAEACVNVARNDAVNRCEGVTNWPDVGVVRHYERLQGKPEPKESVDAAGTLRLVEPPKGEPDTVRVPVHRNGICGEFPSSTRALTQVSFVKPQRVDNEGRGSIELPVLKREPVILDMLEDQRHALDERQDCNRLVDALFGLRDLRRRSLGGTREKESGRHA